MNPTNKSNYDSELIEDIPSSWAKIEARRIILRAQIYAKVTERIQPKMKIICRFTPSASLSKWLDKDPDFRLKLGSKK